MKLLRIFMRILIICKINNIWDCWRMMMIIVWKIGICFCWRGNSCICIFLCWCWYCISFLLFRCWISLGGENIWFGYIMWGIVMWWLLWGWIRRGLRRGGLFWGIGWGMNFWFEERIFRWNFELVFLFGIFNGIDSGSLRGSIVLVMFGERLDIYYLEIFLLGMFFIVLYLLVEICFYFFVCKFFSNDWGGWGVGGGRLFV